MPTLKRTLWIIITVVTLIVNVLMPYSWLLVALNCIPLIYTGYILSSYYRGFRFDTAWGIPYFLLLFLNFGTMEKALKGTAKIYAFNDTFVSLSPFLFTFVFAGIVLIVIKCKQEAVKNTRT